MSNQAWQFHVYPGGRGGRATPSTRREYQELWFRISRLPWASLVLVPAGHGTSAADIAISLAEVGSSLRETPVTAIVAESIDHGSARALAELQPRLSRGGAYGETVDVDAQPVDPEGPADDAAHDAKAFPRSGRAIVAIQAVVDEPLGIAIAHAADAVLLCVELGRSRAGATRRTTALIGRERIIGVVVIRGGAAASAPTGTDGSA